MGEASNNADEKTIKNASKVHEKKLEQSSIIKKLIQDKNIKSDIDETIDNWMKSQSGQTNYFNLAMFIILGLIIDIFFGMSYKSKQKNSRQYRYRNLSSHLSGSRHSDDESEMFKQFITTKLK